ncbi:MAG: hypothetical protein ABJO02_13125 [Reichenbachiella sp.]|uniref:hypothetical protein n=1 Tax=Reichenbachiella sp. TaxID=2184521 RepID=UPI0032994DB1
MNFKSLNNFLRFIRKGGSTEFSENSKPANVNSFDETFLKEIWDGLDNSNCTSWDAEKTFDQIQNRIKETND